MAEAVADFPQKWTGLSSVFRAEASEVRRSSPEILVEVEVIAAKAQR